MRPILLWGRGGVETMEHIRTPKVKNVRLVDKFNPRGSPVGTLYLTTTHLIFVSNSPEDGQDGRQLPG